MVVCLDDWGLIQIVGKGDWPDGWLAGVGISQMVGWLVWGLAIWLVGWGGDWPDGWLAGVGIGQMVGWLGCGLARWLVGWGVD
jgi:hypothetical protein